MSTVTLNGCVVDDDDKWLYDWFEIGCFTPAMVRQAIQDNPNGEDLILEINSGGGSAFAGFEIYSALRAAKCNTVAMVQSLAASAASIVMVGCSHVMLSPVAQVMIHLPATITAGDRNDHMENVRFLDSVTQSILNAYQLRCGDKATRERLEQLVNEATWLPAQDAVALGLADGIMFAETEGATLPLSVVNAVGSGIRAMASNTAAMPDPVALRAQYYQMVANGAKPAPGHLAESSKNDSENPTGEEPDNKEVIQRAKARLELEKIRFGGI